jgi:hypothetical protein
MEVSGSAQIFRDPDQGPSGPKTYVSGTLVTGLYNSACCMLVSIHHNCSRIENVPSYTVKKREGIGCKVIYD